MRPPATYIHDARVRKPATCTRLPGPIRSAVAARTQCKGSLRRPLSPSNGRRRAGRCPWHARRLARKPPAPCWKEATRARLRVQDNFLGFISAKISDRRAAVSDSRRCGTMVTCPPPGSPSPHIRWRAWLRVEVAYDIKGGFWQSSHLGRLTESSPLPGGDGRRL
jgi:hypothetical protein